MDEDWNFHDDEDWGLIETGGEHSYEGLDLSEEINAGHRLRDLRSLAEVSAEELAQHANISAADLLAIEAGLISLEREVAIPLAEGLGVHLLDIWTDEPDDDWLIDEAA